MSKISNERNSITILSIIAIILTFTMCFNLFYIIRSIYRIAMNQEIFSNEVPSLLHGILIYWPQLLVPIIIFGLYIIWNEFDNSDDFAVSNNDKVDQALFNKILRKAILSNSIIPLGVSVFILSFRVGEIYSREMSQLLLGVMQIVTCLLFIQEYKVTIKHYKTNKHFHNDVNI